MVSRCYTTYSVLLALLASIVTVSVFTGPAQAAGEHPYLPSLSKINEWAPNQVCGTTTDLRGDIYVAAFFEGTVYIYDPSGMLLTKFSASELFPCNLATNSVGDVYVNNRGTDVVKYHPSKFPPTEGTIYSFNGEVDNHRSVSVAVDPSNQNVYVAGSINELGVGRVGRIFEYEPDGTLIDETMGSGVPDAKYSSVGVYGANQDVYALDETHNRVYVFNPEGTKILTTIDGTSVFDFPEGFDKLENAHLAVDQSNGDVYVDNIFSHGIVDQFKAEPPSGTYVTHIGPTFGPGGSLHLENPEHYESAIAIDNGSSSPNNGDIYILSQSLAGTAASLYAFGPLTLTISYALTIAKKGNGAGTVTSEPSGITCGSTCSREFEESTKVTLTATPDPGSEFTGWKGCDTESATDQCEVTMSKAKAITANFSITQHTLTIVKSSESSRPWRGIVTSAPAGIQCGTVCSHAYNQNTKVTLIASAATGSVFQGWAGGGCTGTSTCQVTISNDTKVTAIFSGASTAIPPIPSIFEHPLTILKPGPSVLSAPRSATVSDGKTLLKLTCSSGSSACTGTLKLTARIKQGKKTVSMIIGQASCNIAAGGSRMITVKLNNVADRFIKSSKALTVTLTGPAGLNHAVKLRTNTTKKHH